MSGKRSHNVSLWKTTELSVSKAKVKAWVWQFLGYQEGTGCNEGRRAIIAHSRHWEVTKACAELVSWPVFPNDSIQARVMPFSESLFTPSRSSPLFFLSHYLTLIFPMCPIFSHNHPHTYLWLGDLVMAFWPLKRVQCHFYLALHTSLQPQKTMIMPPGNIRAQAEAKSCKTFSSSWLEGWLKT